MAIARHAASGGGLAVAGMSRARVAVLQVVSKQLTVTATAAEYGFSRRHLHRLLVRYREGGLDALEHPPRRTNAPPRHRHHDVRKRVLAFADDHHITAADLHSGAILSVHLIEPQKTYWCDQTKQPGRWPNSPK